MNGGQFACGLSNYLKQTTISYKIKVFDESKVSCAIVKTCIWLSYLY